MQGHASSMSTPKQPRFLVEKGTWFNSYISVYSSHLPFYTALAIIILIVEVIFATPLSLCATIPSVYYVTKVSSPNASVCLVYMHMLNNCYKSYVHMHSTSSLCFTMLLWLVIFKLANTKLSLLQAWSAAKQGDKERTNHAWIRYRICNAIANMWLVLCVTIVVTAYFVAF